MNTTIEEMIWCDSEDEGSLGAFQINYQSCSPEQAKMKIKEKRRLEVFDEEHTNYKSFYGMVAYSLEEGCKYVDGEYWNPNAGSCSHDWCCIFLAMKVYPRDVLAKQDNSIHNLRNRSIMLLGTPFTQWSNSCTLNDVELMTLFGVTYITPQKDIESFIQANKGCSDTMSKDLLQPLLSHPYLHQSTIVPSVLLSNFAPNKTVATVDLSNVIPVIEESTDAPPLGTDQCQELTPMSQKCKKMRRRVCVQRTLPDVFKSMKMAEKNKSKKKNDTITSTVTPKRKTRSSKTELSTPKWRNAETNKIQGVRLVNHDDHYNMDTSSDEDISEERFINLHLPLELRERRIYYLEFKNKKKRSKKAEDVKLVQDTLTWSLDVTRESYDAHTYAGRDKLRGNYDQLWLDAQQYKKEHGIVDEIVPPISDHEETLSDEENKPLRTRNKRRIVRHNEEKSEEMETVFELSSKARKTRPPKNSGKMKFRDAAILLLEEAGLPLSAKEIAQRALDRGLIASKGKTPECTIASSIYTEINRKPTTCPFKYIGPGIFGLRTESDQPVEPICKKSNKRTRDHEPPKKDRLNTKRKKNGVV
jgi:hypothetical protein